MEIFHVALALALICITKALAGPIDEQATAETKALFEGLITLGKDSGRIIFGQHRATRNGIYGQKEPYPEQKQGGWHYSEEMAADHDPAELCDLKALTGDYPGLIGANLKDLEQSDLDVTLELTRQAYALGIVNTYHMAMSNPVTGGDLGIKRDPDPNVLHSIRKILPGGQNHSNFLSILDRLADFAHNITDASDKPIPIIFRPYHENNLKGPWYGPNNEANNTFEEFISMWRFTVEYLRDTKGVHNFLYAFAPSCRYENFTTDSEDASAYLKVYPGDNYVDVMTFDCFSLVKYDDRVPDFVERVNELVLEAETRKKIPALAVIGLNPDKVGGIAAFPDFWTDRVLAPLKQSSVTTRMAYMMTFANRWTTGPEKAWVPYPGHVAAEEFMTFYKNSTILFRNELPDLYS